MNIDNFIFYHDFKLFGFNNKHHGEPFILNQHKKQYILLSYLSRSIEFIRQETIENGEEQKNISFVELFCADAFFTVAANKFGCDECYCVDNFLMGEYPINDLFERLNVNAKFISSTIDEYFDIPRCDIVMNAGGLYHFENPKVILEKSYESAKKYLIVQNVVSMLSEDENHLEITKIPNYGDPNYTKNRFSKQSFDKLIKDLNYNVIDYHFNQLTLNNPDDRGSVYYLIKK